MKVIDLSATKASIEDILSMAKSDTVMVSGIDGIKFIVEEADEFEREAAFLAKSEKFMEFLRERSEERGGKPLSEIAQELDGTA